MCHVINLRVCHILITVYSSGFPLFKKRYRINKLSKKQYNNNCRHGIASMGGVLSRLGLFRKETTEERCCIGLKYSELLGIVAEQQRNLNLSLY